MSESEQRIQEALSAHLEHAELGGPEPDVSSLSADELAALHNLIGLLDQTEGVAFGRGLSGSRTEPAAQTEAGERLVALLRRTLPSAARISLDPASVTMAIPGLAVDEGWVVGTFGGRIRVWLLADQGGLEASGSWLPGLDRVFRLFPDTAALALVDAHLNCLLVQPEDCAPAIEVPLGSITPRRYRRPLQPVGEALSAFLNELVPHWEPLAGFAAPAGHPTDVRANAQEGAVRAIEAQVAAGGRARKTNPKRSALTGLGPKEAGWLAELTLGVYEGRVSPDDLQMALREQAGGS